MGPLNELALFAGCGGGILGGKLIGWPLGGPIALHRQRTSIGSGAARMGNSN